MKFGFLIDPVETLKTATDTSLSFMDFCRRQNDEAYVFTSKDLFFKGEVRAFLQRIYVFVDKEKVQIEYGPVEEKALKDLDFCFLRKDPPFDDHYVQILQILTALEKDSKTLFINAPRGVLSASEKLYTLHFPDYIPRGLVSADPQRIQNFISTSNTPMIIKPVNLFGSRGIAKLMPDELDLAEKIEEATQSGAQYVIVQEFLPEVIHGDKRVFLVDGEICGSISRIPQQGEYRCAVGLGARVELCELNAREREICYAIGPKLREDGLIFVGIDLIQERLIEINVTSPTIVRQWNNLTGQRMEEKLHEFLKKR